MIKWALMSLLCTSEIMVNFDFLFDAGLTPGACAGMYIKEPNTMKDVIYLQAFHCIYDGHINYYFSLSIIESGSRHRRHMFGEKGYLKAAQMHIEPSLSTLSQKGAKHNSP